MLSVFISPNRYSYDFTTLFEMFIQLLVISTEVNVLNEYTALIMIIFDSSLLGLTDVIVRGVQGELVTNQIIFVYILG